MISKKSYGSEDKDTIIEDVGEVEGLAANIQKLRSILRCYQDCVAAYPIPGYKEIMASKKALKENPTVYAGAIKHLTDSEQSIMRCLDAFFARNSEHFADYKSFDLHIHTRFDMCRFCLQCMHERAKSDVYWRKNLGGKQLRVFVSSRQDYRQLEGLLSPYKAMRFIGCDKRSDKVFDETEDQHLLTQGIIFQMAFPHAVQTRIADSLKDSVYI